MDAGKRPARSAMVQKDEAGEPLPSVARFFKNGRCTDTTCDDRIRAVGDSAPDTIEVQDAASWQKQSRCLVTTRF
jgi:hypothetical protein